MKKGIIAGSSIFIFMAIYNVLVFCLVNNFSKNFWTGYIFIMLAFTIFLISTILSVASNRSHHVTGLPIGMISLYYAVLALFLGSLLMYFKINWVAVFLPQMILFLIFAMIYVPAILKFFSSPIEITQQKNN